MNAKIKTAADKLAQCLNLMRGNKASNGTQFCDRLKTVVYTNFLDELDHYITLLKLGVSEHEVGQAKIISALPTFQAPPAPPPPRPKPVAKAPNAVPVAEGAEHKATV